MLGRVTKVLVQGLHDLEIRGWEETIQTTALLRSARLLWRVQDTCEVLLTLKHQWKTIGYASLKNSQINQMIIIIISDTNCNWSTWKIPKGFVKRLDDLEIRGQVVTTQTAAILRLARINRRVLEIWGDLMSLKLLWNTISNRWFENSESVK